MRSALLLFSLPLFAQVLGVPPVKPSPNKGPVRVQAGKPTVAAPKAAPAKPPAIPPTKLIATAGGERITAAKLRELLIGAPAIALTSAKSDPREFLEWTYLMRKLAARGEKEGLAAMSPYIDRLDWSRLQILRTAAFQEKPKQFAPTDAEIAKSYADHPLPYATMRTRILFVAETEGKEAEAKAKFHQALAGLKARKPFADLVQQYSEYTPDGSFPEIGAESKLPADLRLSIAKTPVNGVTAPYYIKGQGHYLFQLTSIDRKPLADVKEEIRKGIREARFKEWLDAQTKAMKVDMLNLPFFASVSGIVAGISSLPQSKEEIKPETKLAVVNGKLITAKDWTNLVKNLPPGIRANATSQPVDFLSQYALIGKIGDTIVKEGWDKKQPWAGRLAYDRGQILMQGVVDRYMDALRVMPEDQRKAFDANPSRFAFAKVKVLYVAYSLTPPPQTDPNAPKILNEDEARAKMDGIVKEIKGGASFVDMVKRLSEDADSRAKDGDGPAITAADPGIPDAIKKPVLAAKTGDLVGPVKLPNGFFLISVVEASRKTYEQVKDEIYDEIRQERFQAWFDGEKKSVEAKVIDAGTFQRIVAEESGN